MESIQQIWKKTKYEQREAQHVRHADSKYHHDTYYSFLLYSNQTWFVNAAIFQSVSMPVESSGGPQVFYTVGTIIDEKVTTGESSIPFNNFLADNSVSIQIKIIQ